MVLGASSVKIGTAGRIPTGRRKRANALFGRLSLSGYKLADKRRFLQQVYHAAYRASCRTGVIRVPLDEHKTPDAQRQVLDALVRSGRLVFYRGRRPTAALKGKCSRFYITKNFHTELQAPLRSKRTPVPNHRNTAVMSRKRREREGRKVTKIAAKQIPFDENHPVYIHTTKLLTLVNQVNHQHDFWGYAWDIFAADCTGGFSGLTRRYNSFLTAKFTDDFIKHGRLYTSGIDGYQVMREVERGWFFIDDARAVEIDYKCLHPRIAYNLSGLPCPDDCYTFLGSGSAARLVAKKILNTAFNATDENTACGSFRKAIRYREHEFGTRARDRAYTLCGAWFDMGKPNANELIAVARQAHEPIADFFFSDAGMAFMRQDSALALDVMHSLAKQGIPCAGFHDSFMVQPQHVAKLKRAMNTLYHARFDFPPAVAQKRYAEPPDTLCPLNKGGQPTPRQREKLAQFGYGDSRLNRHQAWLVLNAIDKNGWKHLNAAQSVKLDRQLKRAA